MKSIASYTRSYIIRNFSLMPYDLSMPHVKTGKRIQLRSQPHFYGLSNMPILTLKSHLVIKKYPPETLLYQVCTIGISSCWSRRHLTAIFPDNSTSHPSSYFEHFLVVKTVSACTLRCTIWMCFWTSTIGSNMHQLTILLASERRLSRASCSGLMLCTLQPSVQPRCGWYTCSLATSRNISDANRILVP